MEKMHKDKLRKMWVDLVNNLTVDELFLAYFIENKIFTKTTKQKIQKKEGVDAAIADIFLDMLVRSGPKAFDVLITALRETNQGSIADKLLGPRQDPSTERVAPMDASATASNVPAATSNISAATVNISAATVNFGSTQPSISSESLSNLPYRGTGDHGESSTVPLSPTDEPDLTQTDGIMTVEIRPIAEDDATQRLIKDSENKKGLYKMLSKPRGTAVIININKFVDESKNREGAEFDSENLTSLFEKLQFDVKLHTCGSRSITAQKLKEIIQEEAQNKGLKEVDCLVVFILSHGGSRGGQDYVLGSDGLEVSVKNDIEAPFYATRCKYLDGKPKIMFINACRVEPGDQGDRSTTEITESMKATSLQDRPSTSGDLKDFFRFYSTVEGFESFRDPKLGSPFVRHIVEVFQAFAYKCNLYELMLKVKQGYPFVSPTYETVDKHVYFFPGYDGR